MTVAQLSWCLKERTWISRNLKMVVLALALWAGCGALMFYSLCARDRSFARVAAPFATATPAAPASSTPQAAAPKAAPIITRQSQRFRLSGSARFPQEVGPLKLRVRRIDARLGSCDLWITVRAHRVVGKKLQLYRPLWIAMPGESEPVKLVLTHISKGRVAGYLERAEMAGTQSP